MDVVIRIPDNSIPSEILKKAFNKEEVELNLAGYLLGMHVDGRLDQVQDDADRYHALKDHDQVEMLIIDGEIDLDTLI